jgi:hypothetical protein
MLMASGLALSLLGTGCVATHKYVAKSIAPVEQRVSGTEGKNVEQDKQLATQGTQIEGIDRDLSRTKERVTDADAKAVAAGDAAKQADSKAQGAQTAADGARGLAQQGVERSTQVGRNLDDYKGNVDKKLATWGPQLKENGPQALADIVMPAAFDGRTLTLEDQTIDIADADALANRRYVWVPSLNAIFGGVLVSYLMHRLGHPEWAAQASHTHLWAGAFNTLVLLSSSLSAVLAHQAAEKGDGKIGQMNAGRGHPADRGDHRNTRQPSPDY